MNTCNLSVTFVTVVMLLGIVLPSESQTLERRIHQINDRQRLSKPVSLSLSPSGAVIAVADQFGDRVYVLDTRGTLLWQVGEVTRIKQPAAVCLLSDNELLLTEKNRRTVLRASSQDLQKLDTIADLSVVDGLKSIDKMLLAPRGTFVCLDASGEVIWFGSDWKVRKRVASHGQGKGKVWLPTDVTLDRSGNIAVSDSRNLPMQLFTSEGVVLFSAGWNSPVAQRGWDASTVAIDLQGEFWVSDYLSSRWRLFDRSGSEVGERPFDASVTHPVAAIFSSDNRLIVADDLGAVLIFTVQ